jgi:hypothetical protein
MEECNNGIEVVKTKYIKIKSESREEDDKPEKEKPEENAENDEIQVENQNSIKDSTNSLIFRETTV